MFTALPGVVAEVVAVEPDDTLGRSPSEAAAHAPVPVRVVDGDADHLPLPDAAADAVVTSLVLCSVPDQASALAEILRVLRGGGEVRYYEHVRSAGVAGVLQDAVTPLWRLAAGGCHPNRRTSEAIRASGLVVETEERFRFRPVRLASSMHVLGRARSA